MRRWTIRHAATPGLAILLAGCPTQENPLGPPVGPPTTATPALALGIGGPGADLVRAVAYHPGGDVIVAGQFTGSVDFDPSTTTQSLTSLGGQDVFLARYSPTGTLMWVAQIGGVQEDSLMGVAIDAAGNLFAGGSFAGSADFDPSATSLSLTSNGGRDGWVGSYDATGALRWARAFGGVAAERVLAVSASPSGAVYAAGQFEGTMPLDPAQGMAVTSVGQTDGFLASWTASGAARWVAAVGGAGADAASAVAAASSGALLVGGWFTGTADLSPGAAVAAVTSLGGTDAFLARFDESGALAWSRGFGGVGDDKITAGGVAVLPSGISYATGEYRSTVDFDAGQGVTSRTSNGGSDLFVVQHDAAGALGWVVGAGGPGDEAGLGLAVAAGGAVGVTGSFQGTARFDPGSAATSLTARSGAGATDLFLVQYGSAGGFQWALGIGAATSDPASGSAGTGVAINGVGQVVVGGRFGGSVDANPGSALAVLLVQGATDGLVAQYTSGGALVVRP